MTQHTRLDIDKLRDLLSYDPASGLLFRRKDDRPALFTLKATGYLWGHVKGKLLLAHRAAWAIVHGEWVDQIDHINRVKTDNRLVNLRCVSVAENSLNREHRRGHFQELKGIGYLPAKRKWIARYEGRYLGCFLDAASAARAFDEVAIRDGVKAEFLNFPNEQGPKV